ncbi:hypothetical protein [Lacibacter sp. H407]|uniref:hypothetical protein n=1 Tax=Lacibacter sp. H407 TaxID=3133423 RepID=UPI0030BB22F5
MEQQELSTRDSLQLIESMINKAQNRFSENGHLYLLWGWVVLVCSITSFIAIYFYGNGKSLMYVWMLTIPTVIYQMIYLARVKKNTNVRTYTDEINSYVWLVFVIMGFLVGIIVGRSGQPQLFNPLVLMLYGMPTFLSGVILKFKPLRIGAICCWVLALVSVLIPYQFSFLLLALAVITTWIVPGYLLRSRFKTQH